MSSAVLVTRLPDPSSSFREDAPRPPVPGEEGETPPCQLGMGKGQAAKLVPVASNTRRNEDGLGEPEGRASPDSPLTRWTKSLHCLLGDQDGAYLFRTFLEREKCVDTLDFWFACNGFRQMNLKDTKTLRVAKAIYKRYIENNSIVSKQLKPATKTYIRDGIKKQQIDSIMFDQAQTEIQSVMEENAYQMFLTSDIYLEYVRSGGENTAYMSNAGLGSLKVLCGYLPTLNEEEEWTCADFKCKLSPTVVGLSSKTLRATASVRSTETVENGYRSLKRSDPVNPYHMGSGCVFAPATSANDSEISSDALTDDSMSLTDSSVDGIPPYRMGSKKQLQREMHRSVKANGQVSLPHFPRTHRLPKEMTPVEPAAFAAELISRLEKLKLELESRHSLEERLQQIREDEEKEGSEQALSSREGAPAQHPLSLLPSGSYEEDPQTILDDHLSRVLKTPGCQSPGMGRYSPRSRSPDLHHHHHHHQQYHSLLPPGGKLPPIAACPLVGSKGFTTKQTTKHVHHHYIHHHAIPKTKEEIEAEATQRVRCFCPGGTEYYCYAKCKSHPKAPEPIPGEQFGGSRGSTLPKRTGKGTEPGLALPSREGGAPGGAGALQLPGEEGDRSQDVWQWMLESERQSKPKPHSAQSTKKAYPPESARGSSGERVSRHHLWGGSGHPRPAPRPHPFTQDPAMPPLTPPNTLAQLEEACRRLAEVSKPPKQRCCVASQQRDRNHLATGQAGAMPFSNPSLAPEDHKEPKKLAGVHALQASELVVTYFFCGEEIPYRRMLKAQSLTLGHFKEQLSKKGNYRYYFKKASDEFACGAVFEEIWDDETVLPMYEGRILGKVERID
ncbi:axin-2 isoform X1 [Ictidomys tridecemlineatus]|uniref:Axin 2 n=1 Tax=Ictidomys tridecemlineatus TaxID=43179 RepID=I3N719_ICTTR|nr:axin-2 isoform X1 [Ictidomys tridecemlineatus]XP_021584097.1 axin-2 isoform X1 [Ictidomys tridecemlineatus]XP_040124496.1 axin-2 isoform X1 [Ictidomys tridecemlineatus]KAG3268616.1 axin 2, transcript variant X1 [Ictidomys tridecemlineatus]KAG3268618.1 axin 2, transcript variant X3 [Ictidomys tridecemlineatus]KAG3268619.1 axin 2, transcript variant X2 [Ictidomys tridecemlineatus]